MPAAPPAAYPVPEATEAHLPAIAPEAPTRQGTVREREATTVLPAHPLPETPPEVPRAAAVLQPDQYIRQGKQVLMSTPAGIQEVSLPPHPDRALQEVREAQAQPEVQVPPIRPGVQGATIPEATQGTPATRILSEIPATLPEVQLQEARGALVHPGTQESLPGIPTVPPEALQGVRAAAIPEAPAAAIPAGTLEVQVAAIRAAEVPEAPEAVAIQAAAPEVRAEVPVEADAGSISMNTSNENSYESI